jgi:hypothetical protein
MVKISKMNVLVFFFALLISIVLVNGCTGTQPAGTNESTGGLAGPPATWCKVGDSRVIDDKSQPIIGVESHTLYNLGTTMENLTMDMCCSTGEIAGNAIKTCTGTAQDQNCTVTYDESGSVIDQYCAG